MSKKTQKQIKAVLSEFNDVEEAIENLVIDIWHLKLDEAEKKDIIAKCEYICELMAKNGMLQDKK